MMGREEGVMGRMVGAGDGKRKGEMKDEDGEYGEGEVAVCLCIREMVREEEGVMGRMVKGGDGIRKGEMKDGEGQ